jgi:hypothetical protein
MVSKPHGFKNCHLLLDQDDVPADPDQAALWEFGDREWASHYALGRGLVHKNHRSKDLQEELDLILTDNQDDLLAVNLFARKRFAVRMVKHTFRLFGICKGHPDPNVPVYLVTLCDRSLLTTDDLPNVPLEAIKKKLRTGLRGLSYVGMVEPAVYINVADYYRGIRRLVAWHGHFLVWNVGGKELKARIDKLNASVGGRPPAFDGVAPGLSGAHFKKIPQGSFGRHSVYPFKSVRKEYSIFKSRRAYEEKGELRFFQRKRKARPKTRVTMFRMMRDMRLFDLVLAGGDGREFMKVIKRETERDWKSISIHFQNKKREARRAKKVSAGRRALPRQHHSGSVDGQRRPARCSCASRLMQDPSRRHVPSTREGLERQTGPPLA